MTPWQEWKKNNTDKQLAGRVSPVDFLNPNTQYANSSIKEERISICEGCPHYLVSKQCAKCGCFMPAKTGLLHASCPIGKW